MRLALAGFGIFTVLSACGETNEVAVATNGVAVATNEVAAATNEVAAATNAAPNATASVSPRRFIDTKIYKLNHASAVEVAEKFNSMWSGEFGQTWKVTKMAVAFEESNSIMITAPGVIQDACAKSILELDREAKQVYIEARFVELGNTASHKVGIDWSMLGGMTGRANLGGGIEQYNVGSAVQNYSRKTGGSEYENTSYSINGGNGSDGSLSYFKGTLDFSEMYLTLRALEATEDAKTFSNPKIIVSSGKKATVDMTTKYPNVSIAAKKTINNNNESVDLDMKMAAIPGEDAFMFAKEAFFSWGITLDVTPRVGTNGLINVTIVPTISQLDMNHGEGGFVTAGTASGSSKGAGNYSSKYPILEVKRLVTEFNMKSGSTAVIGGLSVTEEKQVDNGIPVLCDIPWIGPRIFGSMVRVKEQKEIVVFVTVGLVDPRQMAPDAGLPKNAVLGRQYTKGQKLEPGDRPEKNMEGQDSLDLRLLEEQAKDPLRKQNSTGFRFGDYIPFTKDEDNQK